MKTIKISDTTELLFVEVSETSACNIMDKESMPICLMVTKENGQSYPEGLEPGFKYSILGEVTNKCEINFDCSGFVYYIQIARLGIYGYRNYVKSTDMIEDNTCKREEESFLTLMGKNGIYLNNPMGEEPTVIAKNGNIKGVSERIKNIAWQEYEDHTLKKGNKYLVLLKEVISPDSITQEPQRPPIRS